MAIEDIRDRLDINILLTTVAIEVADIMLDFVRIASMFIVNSIIKLVILIQYFWPLRNPSPFCLDLPNAFLIARRRPLNDQYYQ